ncbi:hypothetical protein U9M48_036599 [Paspalum notatum var. saurae]|uniref:Uncharacterized protein n=1 Tax=Paspalum notatum var. saurae TaxID=547442 RepID=A0AAQ3UET1_PASNO
MTVGLGLLLDLTSRLPRAGASSAAVSSHAGLSAAAIAASAAAAALSSSGVPLSARHLFGFPGFTVAHCDAGTTAGLNGASDLVDDLNAKIRDSIQYARKDYTQYPTKEYPSELKPLFSAFGLKNFTITTLRSFLLYYLPLIQPKPHTDSEDEDDDPLQDTPQEQPVDLVTPFHKSVKQIIREANFNRNNQTGIGKNCSLLCFRKNSMETSQREILRCHNTAPPISHYLSVIIIMCIDQDCDASKSAKRKAARGMSIPQYTFCVARTTFRAHALGVAAAWVVQSIIEVYKCFVRKPSEDDKPSDQQFEDMNKFKLFGWKIYGITVKSCFCLVLASVGAGIGALLHPGHGQWFGCALGDVAGPVIAIIVFEKMQWPLNETRS